MAEQVMKVSQLRFVFCQVPIDNQRRVCPYIAAACVLSLRAAVLTIAAALVGAAVGEPAGREEAPELLQVPLARPRVSTETQRSPCLLLLA
eukprot:323149-Rhodomonas_salina.2